MRELLGFRAAHLRFASFAQHFPQGVIEFGGCKGNWQVFEFIVIQSEDNKKHIEIVLLDKAELIVEAGINAQKRFAQNVLRGLTEEEKHMCIKVFDKICNNAEEYLREYRDNADER